MTRITIRSIVWTRGNAEHIRKHSLTIAEVEDAIDHVVAYRMGYKGRIVLIGRSGKRLLAVIVSKEELGHYYIVTARDADKKRKEISV